MLIYTNMFIVFFNTSIILAYRKYYFSNMDTLSLKSQNSNKIALIYNKCCSGIRQMPTTDSKRLLVRLAV